MFYLASISSHSVKVLLNVNLITEKAICTNLAHQMTAYTVFTYCRIFDESHTTSDDRLCVIQNKTEIGTSDSIPIEADCFSMTKIKNIVLSPHSTMISFSSNYKENYFLIYNNPGPSEFCIYEITNVNDYETHPSLKNLHLCINNDFLGYNMEIKDVAIYQDIIYLALIDLDNGKSRLLLFKFDDIYYNLDGPFSNTTFMDLNITKINFYQQSENPYKEKILLLAAENIDYVIALNVTDSYTPNILNRYYLNELNYLYRNGSLIGTNNYIINIIQKKAELEYDCRIRVRKFGGCLNSFNVMDVPIDINLTDNFSCELALLQVYSFYQDYILILNRTSLILLGLNPSKLLLQTSSVDFKTTNEIEAKIYVTDYEGRSATLPFSGKLIKKIDEYEIFANKTEIQNFTSYAFTGFPHFISLDKYFQGSSLNGKISSSPNGVIAKIPQKVEEVNKKKIHNRSFLKNGKNGVFFDMGNDIGFLEVVHSLPGEFYGLNFYLSNYSTDFSWKSSIDESPFSKKYDHNFTVIDYEANENKRFLFILLEHYFPQTSKNLTEQFPYQNISYSILLLINPSSSPEFLEAEIGGVLKNSTRKELYIAKSTYIVEDYSYLVIKECSGLKCNLTLLTLFASENKLHAEPYQIYYPKLIQDFEYNSEKEIMILSEKCVGSPPQVILTSPFDVTDVSFYIDDPALISMKLIGDYLLLFKSTNQITLYYIQNLLDLYEIKTFPLVEGQRFITKSDDYFETVISNSIKDILFVATSDIQNINYLTAFNTSENVHSALYMNHPLAKGTQISRINCLNHKDKIFVVLLDGNYNLTFLKIDLAFGIQMEFTANLNETKVNITTDFYVFSDIVSSVMQQFQFLSTFYDGKVLTNVVKNTSQIIVPQNTKPLRIFTKELFSGFNLSYSSHQEAVIPVVSPSQTAKNFSSNVLKVNMKQGLISVLFGNNSISLFDFSEKEVEEIVDLDINATYRIIPTILEPINFTECRIIIVYGVIEKYNEKGLPFPSTYGTKFINEKKGARIIIYLEQDKQYDSMIFDPEGFNIVFFKKYVQRDYDSFVSSDIDIYYIDYSELAPFPGHFEKLLSINANELFKNLSKNNETDFDYGVFRASSVCFNPINSTELLIGIENYGLMKIQFSPRYLDETTVAPYKLEHILKFADFSSIHSIFGEKNSSLIYLVLSGHILLFDSLKFEKDIERSLIAFIPSLDSNFSFTPLVTYTEKYLFAISRQFINSRYSVSHLIIYRKVFKQIHQNKTLLGFEPMLAQFLQPNNSSNCSLCETGLHAKEIYNLDEDQEPNALQVLIGCEKEMKIFNFNTNPYFEIQSTQDTKIFINASNWYSSSICEVDIKTYNKQFRFFIGLIAGIAFLLVIGIALGCVYAKRRREKHRALLLKKKHEFLGILPDHERRSSSVFSTLKFEEIAEQKF